MVSQLLVFFIFTFVSTWVCARFLRDSGLGDESWIVVDEFAAEPLRLCGMLVQEDLYLLQEDDVNTPTPPAVLTEYHAEDHPSVRHLIGSSLNSKP